MYRNLIDERCICNQISCKGSCRSMRTKARLRGSGSLPVVKRSRLRDLAFQYIQRKGLHIRLSRVPTPSTFPRSERISVRHAGCIVSQLILRGATFSGCSVTHSAKGSEGATSGNQIGINMHGLFGRHSVAPC